MMTTGQAFKFIFAQSGKAKGRMANAKKQMLKATGGAPEVMAKITGFTKADQSTRGHLDYITRNGQVDAFDRFGLKLEKDEVTEKRMDYDSIKGRKAMRLVLSMPPNTEIEPFKKAVEQTLQKEFGEHDYLYVFHEDTSHPHAHIVVPMTNSLDERINPRKADIQRYRQTFADELEKNGILANATTTQLRKQGMLSKVFGNEPNRNEPSTPTKERIDVAWRLIKKAFIQAGDSEGVQLINQLAPRQEKKININTKSVELGD
ncbi:MAG: hypothetical protein ACI9SP_004027 [Arenicella sp.]|jgi:hypothetical protein